MTDMKQFLETFHDYFDHLTICLLVFNQEAGKRPQIEYSSAFLMFFENIPFLVTAGHTCQAIKQYKSEGTLAEIRVVYRKSQFNDESFLLDIDSMGMNWRDSPNDLDIGVIALPKEVLESMAGFGIRTVGRDNVRAPSNDPNKLRIAIGFSANHSIESDNLSHYVVSDGAVTEMRRADVFSVGRRSVVMRGFEEKRNSQFVGLPLHDNEDSLVGMSGCIVIEVMPGQPIKDYALVGIQSGQSSVEKSGSVRVTKIYVNDAVVAIETIENSISDLKNQR